jgi:hypothetical protein
MRDWLAWVATPFGCPHLGHAWASLLMVSPQAWQKTFSIDTTHSLLTQIFSIPNSTSFRGAKPTIYWNKNA